MNIVFMGTPDFAASILNTLAECGHNITAVYTQPDKPKGRSGALIAPPVKECALERNIPVYQPERIKRPENVEELKKITADVFVVAAYGQILSQEILDIPQYGCINVHGSLLPEYRGAAPIQRAIADGNSKTGVTIMQMDKGMDTGDILLQRDIDILDSDTEDSIYEKMAVVGSDSLIYVLRLLEDGTLTPVPQNNELATYAPPLKKEEGLLDFDKTARALSCIVRGFQSWPTAYTGFGGKMLKIYMAKEAEADMGDLMPGQVMVTKKNLYVMTGLGALELIEVQLEGKKRMSAMDFARGTHLATGDILTL